MKKWNLFLLLKQGIKGVFKFKIQFFTMIILVFISSFITTVTLANNKYLERNYNQTMKKMNKFDYLINDVAGTENMILNKESTVPLMDAINNQFIEDGANSFYNFNISSFNDQQINDVDKAANNYGLSKYNQTFITKVFEQGINEKGEIDTNKNYLYNALISIFDQTANNLLDWKKLEDSYTIGSLKSIFIFEKNKSNQFNHVNYVNPSKELTINASSRGFDRYPAESLASALMLTIGTQLKIQLFEDLKKYAKYQDQIKNLDQISDSNENNKEFLASLKYLENSTIFKFWNNLPDEEKNRIVIDQPNSKKPINSNDFSKLEVELVKNKNQFEKPTNWKDAPLYEKYKLKGEQSSSLFSTLINVMVRNIVEQVLQNWESYSTNIFNKALEQLGKDDNDQKLIEKLQNLSGLQYKFWDREKEKNNEYSDVWNWRSEEGGKEAIFRDFKNNIKILLEYSTGRIYNNGQEPPKEYDQKKYIVSKDNKAYVLNIDNSKFDERDNNPKSEEESVLKKGCRGNLVVPYIINPESKKFTRIGSYPFLLNTVGGNSSIAQMLHYDYENIGFLSSLNYNSKDFKIEPVYMTQTLTYFIRYRLLAQLYDLDYTFRIERTMIDNDSERIYRLVNLDDEWMNDKLTIYTGFKPLKDYQVLVNPQFLAANKLKVNDQIKIGPAVFDIVGTAADPLSYYPMVDLTNPIPNSKSNGIIYATGNNLAKIFKENYHKSIKQNVISFFNVNNKNTNKLEKVQDLQSQRYSSSANIKNNYLHNIGKLTDEQLVLREDIVNFNNINYKINYTLQPKVRRIINIALAVTTIIIVVISCATTYIAIQKTVILNKEQIYILKALGLKNNQIAIGYISYGIICLFIIIPLAYILGTFAQIGLLQIFLQYFGGTPYQLTWYWLPFVICAFLFGLVIIIFSYIAAIQLIKKQNKEKISFSEDKNKKVKVFRWRSFKEKVSLFFSKRFGFRFILLIKISSRGIKKIISLVTVVFISTLLISTSLTIPTVIANIKSSLNKSVNFKNRVDFYEPLINSPLSGDSVAAENDIDSYKNDLFDVKDENAKKISNIYRSVQKGSGFTTSSTIPPFIYTKPTNGTGEGELEWTIKYAWNKTSLNEEKKNSEEEKAALLGMLVSIFSSNLFNFDGKSFSIMDFQNLIESVLHDDTIDKEQKEEYINKLIDLIELVTKDLLKMLFNRVDFQVDSNWKDILIDFIAQNTPPFVSSYILKDDNRKLRFQIGWNATKYVPGKDNLVTELNVNSFTKNNKKTEQEIIGVSQNQTAFKLNQENKKIFISQEKLKELKDVYNGLIDSDQVHDIYLDGTSFKLYDANTKTLNVPTIFNEQASSKFKDIIENANFAKNKLLINDKYPLPKSSWVYDDRDYLKVNNKGFDKKNSFRNMFELEQSKFTHSPVYQYQEVGGEGNENKKSNFANVSRALGKNKNQFDTSMYVSEISDKSYWFTEVKEDQEKPLNFKLTNRPYYTYDNILLVLPKEFEKDVKNSAKEGILKVSDEAIWMGDIKKDSDFYKSEVFENIKKEWKNIDPKYENDEYIFVRPYTVKFVDELVDEKNPKFTEQNLTGKEIFMLVENGTTFWYRRNFENNGFIKVAPQEFVDTPNRFVKKINFVNDKSFNKLKTYGNATALADQDLINLVCGYENTKNTPFYYQYNTDEVKGTYDYLGNKIENYSVLKPDAILNNQELRDKALPQDQLKYRQNRWFNSVLSNDHEAKMLTTQTSFIRQFRLGDNTIQSDNIYTSNVQFKDVELRGAIDNLINQLTDLTTIVAINIIIIIIIVSSLTLTVIIDLYINDYRSFISIMKAMGYSNGKITFYILSIVSILSLIIFVLATVVSILLVFIMIKTASYFGFGLPFVISWWTPIAALIILLSVYLLAIAVSTYKLRHSLPAQIIKRND